jgi:hypothetical protein
MSNSILEFFLLVLLCLGVQTASLWASVREAVRAQDPQQSVAVLTCVGLVGAAQRILFAFCATLPFTPPTLDDYFPPTIGYGLSAVLMGLLAPGYYVLYFFVRAGIHFLHFGTDAEVPAGTAFYRRAGLVYSGMLLLFLSLSLFSWYTSDERAKNMPVETRADRAGADSSWT